MTFLSHIFLSIVLAVQGLFSAPTSTVPYTPPITGAPSAVVAISTVTTVTTTATKSYYLAHGNFSASFPEQPTFFTEQQDFGNGNSVLDDVYGYTINGQAYELMATYAASAFANLTISPEENLENELSYTANEDGDKLISLTATTYDGLPAVDYRAYVQASNMYAVGEDIANGNDLYMIGYYYFSGKEDKALENSFLNSVTFPSPSSNNTGQTATNAATPMATQPLIPAPIPVATPTAPKSLPEIIAQWSPSVAIVVCTYSDGSADFGSGFLDQTSINGVSGINVVTNKHVFVEESTGDLATSCAIKIPEDGTNYYTVEAGGTPGGPSPNFLDSTEGYDFGDIVVPNGDTYFNDVAEENLPICQQQEQTGDSIIILGYPDYAGQFTEPTATQGIISGYAAPYYTTSAEIESGNSGGVAIDTQNDCYVGIPSAVAEGNYGNLGRILSAAIPYELLY